MFQMPSVMKIKAMDIDSIHINLKMVNKSMLSV